MKKTKINPEEVLKDANKIMDMINNLENIDLDNIDILEKDLKELEKSISEKYKDQLEKESEENLDSKE
tara:strand:+ start:262 stop:465 length:204 start_codon:yes stop_codon:yes gene_type:complete